MIDIYKKCTVTVQVIIAKFDASPIISMFSHKRCKIQLNGKSLMALAPIKEGPNSSLDMTFEQVLEW